MSKPAKSQWNFGELFPTEETRKVLSVSELTAQVRRLLEKSIGQTWVGGEVSNFRAQSSGHRYFTLKDAGAQLSCVLFSRENVPHRELLADGQKVLLQGDLTVYEARGQYQLIVRAVELQGVGALQLKFEQLKQRLAAEGLFAPERKRLLPTYPQRVGLVTSPTGAAIRDVLHVLQRRDPGLQIILVPARVQGDGAAAEIASAIRLLNQHHASGGDTALDLILITRGGGSLEDLWAFNEEAVARAIFESDVPVVSAVGHEIDFTIADFVADLRAATPSAAAEIITQGVVASREFIHASDERLRYLVGSHLSAKADELVALRRRLALLHPRRRLNESAQRLDDLAGSLGRSTRQGLRERQAAARTLAERIRRVRPMQLLQQRREFLNAHQRRLLELGRAGLQQSSAKLKSLDARLRLLGPEQVLARGYSITLDAHTGAVVRDAAQVKAGQRLTTRLKSGQVASRVEPS
ncbi:MAG: exodeoxyribonuclease VII large subunit [Verrucomicrobiota bacterium]